MGNCQAVDTATLVIQYPSGKSEKLFWPVSAAEVMKTNPGHYVALLISTTLCPQKSAVHADPPPNLAAGAEKSSSVRLTRIKLLRATDTLVLGQVYRLITAQEVMKGLWAKKQAKQKRSQSSEGGIRVEIAGSEENNKVVKHERHRAGARTGTSSTSSANASAAAAKSRTWQPSLNSISEASS